MPARTSIQLVDAHASDAGLLGTMPPRQLDGLSRYLAARTRGARYEIGVKNYIQAAALIVHDARPVIIFEGVDKRPIASLATVRAAARRGDLRYVMLGGTCGRARSVRYKHCSPAVRWIRAHSVEVRGVAGIKEPGLLFKVRPRGLMRSQHGSRPR